jgi:hypothetical protein
LTEAEQAFFFYEDYSYCCWIGVSTTVPGLGYGVLFSGESQASKLFCANFLLGSIFDLEGRGNVFPETSFGFHRASWRYIPEDRYHQHQQKQHNRSPFQVS